MLFPVTPEILYGVEFRGVSWETFYPDFTVQTFQVFAHELASVGGYSVPDDEELALDVTLEVLQEIDHLLGLDRTGVEPKIKIPPRQSGDGRELLPVEVELQDRGLSFRAPSAYPMWLLAQATLVDED